MAVARRRRVAEISVAEARKVRLAFGIKRSSKTVSLGRVMLTLGSAWT